MKYTPATIVWNDACHYTFPATEQDLKNVLSKAKTKVITDIGFILEETDEKIIFCSKIIGDDRFDKVSVIPRGMIKDIMRLKPDESFFPDFDEFANKLEKDKPNFNVRIFK